MDALRDDVITIQFFIASVESIHKLNILSVVVILLSFAAIFDSNVSDESLQSRRI